MLRPHLLVLDVLWPGLERCRSLELEEEMDQNLSHRCLKDLTMEVLKVVPKDHLAVVRDQYVGVSWLNRMMSF